MDIGRLSMGMSNVALSTAVSLAVTKLQMNSMNEMAVNMQDMMSKMAVNPNVGTKIDVVG
ncbi:YjfB family protein [Clostridium senegalense]|uniref:YjfB family protein n=1 Tax=Clostridium senegalense TaxID=1465809 RepID=UPI000287C55E|nr:YjfB family protein [Clostridium senegalense]MBU5226051.1 YjfB family protein [Clostridium senegalense]